MPGTDVGPRLKIMQLCAPTAVGGLESVVLGISRGLVERGHSLTFVASVSPGHDSAPLLEQMEAAGVRAIALEYPSRDYFREWNAVRKLLDELRPDILHTHGYRSDILHGSSARRRKIAAVSTLHGYMIQGGLSRLGSLLQRYALRHFDAVIAVSRPIMEDLAGQGVQKDRLHYIQNAWSPTGTPFTRREARERLGLPADGKVLGWIGRMVPVKGADVFVRSLASLQTTDWTACMIGEGPEIGVVREIVAQSGLEGRVNFAGTVHGASRYLEAFDLLALSSRYEGTPIVALEAMGAGVPIVSTAVGGVPELLGGGAGGWLVPPEDPPALASAMDAVLSLRKEAEARVLFGRTRVESELSVKEWARLHEGVYLQAMAGLRSERHPSAAPRTSR